MATYSINFTDINVTPIIIDQGDVDTTSTDVALFGRIDLEYGQLLNEDLLHLLENFSCPEDPNNIGNPDLSIAVADTLSNPIDGQVWYNSTQGVPFVWDSSNGWTAVASSADYGANSGKIYHNQQLPLPLSSSGYQFTYDECVWIVSPSGVQESDIGDNGFTYMVCTTDDNGLVNHQYAESSYNELIPGIANYIIIGMRNGTTASNPHNHNYDESPAPPPPPFNSTVTPTMTPSAGADVTPTPTPTLTVTNSLTITPTRTITPTFTPTLSLTPSPSRELPISATIYINPSTGLSSLYGGSASLTDCTTGATNCEESLGIWVVNPTGGNGGPYTITWNLQYFYVVTGEISVAEVVDTLVQNVVGYITEYVPATAPPDPSTGLYPSAGSTYSGSASGYTCYITGSVPGIIQNGSIPTAYCKVNYVTGYTAYTATITLVAGSKVTISDSSGNSTTYYTPSGTGGQVSGTQLTSAPSSNYTDSYYITSGSSNNFTSTQR